MYNIKIYTQIKVLAILVSFSIANAQNNPEDDFKLANNLFRDAGDYATASKLFGEFILNYPNSPQIDKARLLLARSFAKNDRCELAENAFEDFFTRHPEHLEAANARLERAVCLSNRGLFIKAAETYREIQTRYSSSNFASESLLNAAKNYVKASKTEEAISVLENLLDLYVGTDSAEEGRFQLTVLLIDAQRSEEAQNLLDELINSKDPKQKFLPSALLLSGRMELVQNTPETANNKFAKLHTLFSGSPQSDSAYFEFANYLYKNELFPQAGDSFAIATKKINTESIRTRALLRLADSRRKSTRGVDALKHYEELLSTIQPAHPDYLPARLGQAIALGETGSFSSAVSLFRGIITVEQQPESLIALRELGDLFQRRGNLKQAVRWYEQYDNKTHGKDQTTKLAIAKLYAALGDLEKSISVYRKMSSYEAQFELAKVLEVNNKPRDALREYTALIENNPESPFTNHAKKRIHFLRKFVVLDPQELNRLLQQSWVDELNGKSRQNVQFDVAHAFYKHHDFINATRSFEHFAAAYPTNSRGYEAQFFLAESLTKLARQRAVENITTQSDSLLNLALQEFRVLARENSNQWSTKAQLRLIELQIGENPDSLQLSKKEQSLKSFLDNPNSKNSSAFERGLLLLAQTQGTLGERAEIYIDSAFSNYKELRQLFPNSRYQPEALFGIGQCLSMRGDINAAMDTLSNFLHLFPENKKTPTVLFELAQLLRIQNQKDEAVKILQELQWGYPFFIHRHYAMEQLGDIYIETKEYGAAAEVYESLSRSHMLTDSKRERDILKKLGRTQHLQGNYLAAQRTYYSALEKSQESTGNDSITFELGIILLQLGNKNQAINKFLDIGEQFPNSSLAREGLARAGHISFAMNDYPKSVDLYGSLITKYGNPDSLVYGQYAIALFRTEDFDAGNKIAKSFKKRFDGSWGPRFDLEVANHYRRIKQYVKALESYKNLAQTDSPLSSEAAYNSAMLLWDRNKNDPSEEGLAQAIEGLNRFVKTYPESVHLSVVFFHIANHHYSLRNYLQAAGAYKRVINDAKTRSLLREEAIWLLLKSYSAAHEYEAAHQVANQILKNFPNHSNLADIRLELGVILKEKGRYREAIRHFSLLIDHKLLLPNGASEARFYIGESFQNLGEYRQAIEAYYKVSYHGADGSAQWITSADFQRAKCHESLSEFTTAIAIYNRVIQREGGSTPQGEMANEKVQILRHRLDKLNLEEL